MPVTVKYGSTKRFGARYGRRIKEKLGKIELERKKKQVCPYCAKAAAVRKSAGIWTCRHCDATFTGFAYSVSQKIIEEKKDVAFTITSHPVAKEEEIPEEEA